MTDLDRLQEGGDGAYHGPKRNPFTLPPSPSHIVPTNEFVRFCCICGEREDSPYRGAWCDPDPYGQPDMKHIWDRPQRMFKRIYDDPVENRVDA